MNKGAKNSGKRHKVTKFLFSADGFPIFDSLHDVVLPAELIGNKISDGQQMRYATRTLRDYLESNTGLKAQFTQEQLENITKWVAEIKDFTWHHHEDGVTLQLVDRWTHSITGHAGGRSLK